ncbi:MAG: hypothetical protein LBQ12_13300 [Deltaproteobacteria bacterium]|nr:hypothetical protein [Deltaproteobacteria bacterium]
MKETAAADAARGRGRAPARLDELLRARSSSKENGCPACPPSAAFAPGATGPALATTGLEDEKATARRRP